MESGAQVRTGSRTELRSRIVTVRVGVEGGVRFKGRGRVIWSKFEGRCQISGRLRYRVQA